MRSIKEALEAYLPRQLLMLDCDKRREIVAMLRPYSELSQEDIAATALELLGLDDMQLSEMVETSYEDRRGRLTTRHG